MVRIRLRRVGKKKNPVYQVIAADKRAPRDGKFLEKLGWYNPKDGNFSLRMEQIELWIKKGAVPTNTVKNLMKRLKKQPTKKEVDDERTN